MPVEKGVRHGYTEALSGTAVLGGEGHFSLLDTVGDREGRSSIGGLLGGGQNRRQGGGESREWSAQAVQLWSLTNTAEGAHKGWLSGTKGCLNERSCYSVYGRL